MPPLLSHVHDPIATFCELYQLLRKDLPWWGDSAWLRFAAQAAALSPDNAHDTVQRIRATADALSLKVPWYSALASPLRLVVAATLVQIGDTAESFTAEVESVRQMYVEAGLHVSGSSAIKAILAVRVLTDAQHTTPSTVMRMRQIYTQFKQRHWWLTSGEHVTACAILSQCALTPEALAGISDDLYHSLVEHGSPGGSSLWTAATILPVLGLSANDAADRFIALSATAHSRLSGTWTVDGDAMALLCLLDHHPDRIVGRLEEVLAILCGLEPVQFAEVNIHVAADLVFLDLVQFDDHMRTLSGPDDGERVHALVRQQRALSLLLVRAPATPVMIGGGTWPTPGQ